MGPEKRYRMQSNKTGWGIEAPYSDYGKQELHTLRRKEKEKYKYCRIYVVNQIHPEVVPLYEPFKLTFRKFFS